MNAPSIDIKDLMVLEGTWEFGTDLFIGTQPTTPMNCTTIFDTSTNPPDGTVSGNKVFLHESLMMWVRNSSYEAAYLEAQAIISILHNKARFTLSSTYYLYANLQSGPNTLTEGGEDYSEFSINFELLRKSGIAASSSFLTFADLVTDLVAGTNITLTVDETEETITIASTAITTVSWGDIEGSISAQTDLVDALALKVDKEAGKGLSANDYTDLEKTKLGNIADGAEVNVNADWDSSSGDSEILNKPTIIAQTEVDLTIAVADWLAGTTAVKTVTGVTATSTQLYNMIKVNQDLWGEFNLCANAQATDQITFVSDSTPTSEIVVKILIQKPL